MTTHQANQLELNKAKDLLDRWNRAVKNYTPLAGSEYIDEPEITMRAVAQWAELSRAIEEKKASMKC